MFSSCCCCCCCHRNKYDLEYERSRRIDKEIERERRVMKRQVKVLLLGAGESGKSTFLKQMRIIHNVPFSEGDLLEFRQTIYVNIVQGTRVLCDARSKLNIPWQQEEKHKDLEKYSNSILATNPSTLDQYKFSELVPGLGAIWGDGAIKQVWGMRSRFQISDSVEWFLDELERIGGKDFSPSQRDILLVRRATKGIHQLQLMINNIPFTFYDIGGQRTQRAKWIQCFEAGLTSLIFMVAVNEWDQFLAEDRSQNRLSESQSIFSLLINNRIFQQVAVILFLNKYDLLIQKHSISSSTLPMHFPDFHGDHQNLTIFKNYLLSLFTSVNRVKKELYYHWTTAVDTNGIRVIFNAVKNTILKRNLGDLMLE